MTTNRQREALVITMEECGELVQACSKVIRSSGKKKYIKNLNHEAGDVLAMIDILIDLGYLDKEKLHARVKLKNEKLKLWSNIFDEQ